jgi:hypothetical protein
MIRFGAYPSCISFSFSLAVSNILFPPFPEARVSNFLNIVYFIFSTISIDFSGQHGHQWFVLIFGDAMLGNDASGWANRVG